MTDYGTIKIPRDAYERHNERRQQLGLNWKDYIDGNAPQHHVPDADEIASRVVAAMDTEGLGTNTAVNEEDLVNDLVAQLPPKIVERLER